MYAFPALWRMSGHPSRTPTVAIMPEGFRLRGIYYETKIEGTEYRVTPTTK